ncbi:MAG: twin-arginine translocase subunit TatC [Actinomycetota bacterium]|nr:twin-arginine translocase subunit TatC [Actinomycetota bacterium]
MSLGQHLVELRKRLVISGIAILAGTVGGWFLSALVWDGLRAPILVIASAHHQASINYPSITSAWDVRFQVAIMIGILVSSPIWLYQVFAFLVPGLNGRERRYIFGFFFTAVPLFLAGAFVGWLVLPRIVNLMVSFVPGQDTSIIDAKYYLDFVIKLILATGIAFVLPVFLVLLNFIGILSARSILRGWRWAVLAITIFTAIATPAADPFSMLLLAFPMVVLYFAAFGVAALHDRAIARRADALSAELAGA